MKKTIAFVALVFLAVFTKAQELYVFSEPASNMPSNTVSPKLKAVVGARENYTAFQRYTPELMFGINKKVMIHAAGSFSNMFTRNIAWEGAYLYGKYRFYSADEVHQHLRLAAFTEIGYSKNEIFYDDISVRGDNSGIDVGLIATQLKNKLAVSATTSFLKLFKYKNEYHTIDDKALNYSLSAGYLVLPFEYKNYNQLNLNIYTEFLGQKTFGKGTYYIDAAPAIQLIFNSNSKLNLGYRFQLKGDAMRSVDKSFLISFEHTFFNALRKN